MHIPGGLAQPFRRDFFDEGSAQVIDTFDDTAVIEGELIILD